MANISFRPLKMGEIKCRVQRIAENKKGAYCTMILYTDARAVMDVLDETVGADNWQREHYECKGNMFCRIGINVGIGDIERWIWKSDCGTESYTEKEKGEASDSFKRAAVNWGIGRELHSAPFIYIPLQPEEVKKVEKGGKDTLQILPNVQFHVAYVKTDIIGGSAQITRLCIKDKKGEDRFCQMEIVENDTSDIPFERQMDTVELFDLIQKLNYDEKKITSAYHVDTIEQMTAKQIAGAKKQLKARLEAMGAVE